MFTFSISKHHSAPKPPTNQTHKPRKIIKPTWKKTPRNLKQTTTRMEKQTQAREIMTNTNWSINYMPQPSDEAPCVVTLIPGDGIRPLVIGAVERRRMLRENWRNRFGTMRLRLSWRSSMFDEKLTQSLIYKPILSPLPPSDPLANLAAVRATSWSRRCQTHSPILPPSDPPTNLWSFTSLFLSIYLSLSLSHDQCLFLRKTDFFGYVFCWFGLYI